MIPSKITAKTLWDTYNLPAKKRIHVELVARVADFLATRYMLSVVGCQVNRNLLQAAALLHDIDKAVPKLSGEQHPGTGVRILMEEGMEEVAAVVRTHSVHAILDPAIAPTTIEEKLLFLADKMVKYEVITVDKRFALWNAEQLPPDAQKILDTSYPKVKELEREIFGKIAVKPEEVASFV